MKSNDLLLFLMMQGLIPFKLSKLGVVAFESVYDKSELGKPFIKNIDGDGNITVVTENHYCFSGLNIKHVEIADDTYYVCNKQNNYVDLVNVYDLKTANSLCEIGNKTVPASKVWEESDVIINLKKHKFKL